jgi:hypothetical protein
VKECGKVGVLETNDKVADEKRKKVKRRKRRKEDEQCNRYMKDQEEGTN